MLSETTHLTEEQLALFASEEPDERSAAHLARCEQCRRRWHEYQRLRAALRALPSPALPRDFSFLRGSFVVLRPSPWWWRYRVPIRLATAMAATLLLLLVTATLALPGRVPGERSGEVLPVESPVVALATIQTPESPGAGGSSEPAPAAVAGTPIAGSASEASAQSVPAETPVARVATEEPEPPPSQARERPLVVLGLAVFLAVVTVAGVVFGFILPALYRSGRRAARR